MRVKKWIFNLMDVWVDRYCERHHISTKPSVSRWGITQIVFSVALFFVASAIALVSLWLSLWGVRMIVAGWFALGFAILCLGVGVFAICYMFHLSGKWLEDQEPSPEFKAIQEVKRDIQRFMIIRRISRRITRK